MVKVYWQFSQKLLINLQMPARARALFYHVITTSTCDPAVTSAGYGLLKHTFEYLLVKRMRQIALLLSGKNTQLSKERLRPEHSFIVGNTDQLRT
jgi:hypothetical protein